MWRINNNGEEIRKKDVAKLLNKILSENSFTATIANGFRIYGLYPFSADSVDYSKCTKQYIDRAEEKSDLPKTTTIADHLAYLESKIDLNLLQNFKDCRERNDIPINDHALLLFNVWSNILIEMEEQATAATHNNEVNNFQNNLSTDILEFSFPEYLELMNDHDQQRYFIF